MENRYDEMKKIEIPKWWDFMVYTYPLIYIIIKKGWFRATPIANALISVISGSLLCHGLRLMRPEVLSLASSRNIGATWIYILKSDNII